jgi:signal peptide peptidase SppA
MSIKEERCWAGSEASYETALEAEIKIAAGPMREDEDEDEESPRLLAVSDGLAIITIKGPLVNNDSPYLRMFGVTGYPEIRDAVLAAVSDPEVKQILLDIDSGGGAVSGCADTATLIRSAHKVKPITTYGETMASAAYWLGCSAGKVYSGKASLIGSIGVKATFREYSKKNEMEGVTVTVIRAGKYKALADSNEPLSPEGEAQIQAMADASYGVFVEHVAEMRGRTYEYTDKTMADGQEFIGQAAVDVGLTDGITTFDAVVGGLKKKILASLSKPMDNTGTNRFKLSGDLAPTTPEDSTMAKKALTEADIAALAAGATIEAVVATVDRPNRYRDSRGAEWRARRNLRPGGSRTGARAPRNRPHCSVSAIADQGQGQRTSAGRHQAGQDRGTAR